MTAALKTVAPGSRYPEEPEDEDEDSLCGEAIRRIMELGISISNYL